MTFDKRLEKRMLATNIKGVDITKATGVTSGGVSQWVNGATKPKGKNLIIIAKMLKCSPEWLLTGKGSPDKGVSNVLPADLITKKVLGSISAGNLKELIEMDLNDDLESVYLPKTYLNDDKYFVLTVDGDSMTSQSDQDSFNDGDFLVFEHKEHRCAEPNNYVLSYNNHDKSGVFKKLIKDGGTYYLKPLNRDYLPMRQMNEHEEILGILVYWQPRGRKFT